MSADPLKQHLEIGYVERPHGLKGEVVVHTYDPNSEVMFDVERVRVRLKSGEEKELEIASINEHSGELKVAFTGVTTRDGSDALKGATVLVFRDDLDEPDEGEFFQGDLVGLTVVSPEGVVIGRVHEVWSSGPVPNLVIHGPTGEELMVPFAEEFVPSVDLEGGKVTVIVPEMIE